MDIQKTGKRCAALLCAAVMLTSLSGCGIRYGVGETVKLVVGAEQAKNSVENLSNTGSAMKSVGTTADPNYKANNLVINGFDIVTRDNMFATQWSITSARDDITVQIFADIDQVGTDGIKIASYPYTDIKESGPVTFEYPLDPGVYYCYIKVTSGNAAPVYLYAGEPIEVVDPKANGMLQNVSAVQDGEKIAFSWDADDHTVYRAAILDPVTGDELGYVVTSANNTTIDLPAGVTAVHAIAASFEDGIMGPYSIIELSELTPVTAPATTEE